MPTVIIFGPDGESLATKLATIDMCERSIASIPALGVSEKNVNAIYLPTTQKKGCERLIIDLTELFTIGYDGNQRTKTERKGIFKTLKRDCSRLLGTGIFKNRPDSILILIHMVDRAKAMSYEWDPPLYQYDKKENRCLIRMWRGKPCNYDNVYPKYVEEAMADFPGLSQQKISYGNYGDNLTKPIFGITFTPLKGYEVPPKYTRVKQLTI